MTPTRQLDMFRELIVDNFAGGGGASAGIEMAIGRPIDHAINHNPEALAMHEANHPLTEHHCENVWEVDPLKLSAGRPVGLAWFSPDCTHFSKAKNAKPVRDKKIRGLAWVALRWAALVKPRIIMLENVEEFLTWGPLDSEGQPIKLRRGRTFLSFVNALKRQGYDVDWKPLVACDYGAPTSRKRLFLIARRDGMPIVWPEPTHNKSGTDGKKPWRTAAEIIDWNLPVPSIFTRKKELAPNTLRRIARGVQKYVLDTPTPFIVQVNHTSRKRDEFRGQGLDEPIPTLTQKNGHGLVVPTLIQEGFKEREGQAPRVPGLENPLGTVCAKRITHALTTASLVQYNGENERRRVQNNCTDIESPLNTITASGGRHALQVVHLMSNHGGNAMKNGKVVARQPTEPLRTITAQNQESLVAATLMRQMGESNCVDINDPAPTIMPGGAGKTSLLTASLFRHFGSSDHGLPVDAPCPTIMSDGAGGKTGVIQTELASIAAFMHQYNGGDKEITSIGTAMTEPVNTIPSRDRFSLITVVIAGREYVIVDIGFRMLEPHELFAAQGFPKYYEIKPMYKGKPMTKTAQVEMVGNSVSPCLSHALVRANYVAPEMKAVG